MGKEQKKGKRKEKRGHKKKREMIGRKEKEKQKTEKKGEKKKDVDRERRGVCGRGGMIAWVGWAGLGSGRGKDWA